MNRISVRQSVVVGLPYLVVGALAAYGAWWWAGTLLLVTLGLVAWHAQHVGGPVAGVPSTPDSPLDEGPACVDRIQDVLARMLDILPHAVAVKGEDHRVLLANSACEFIYGVPVDRVCGRHMAELLIFPEEAELFERDDLAVLAHPGQVMESEIPFTDADGRPRLLLSRKVAVVAGDERLILASYADISPLRGVAESFRASLRTIDVIIDAIPDGMALLSAEGVFIRVNAALCTVLQRRDTEIIGLHYSEITPPEYAELDALHHQELLRDGQSRSFDKAYLLPDGGRVPVRILRMVSVSDVDGQSYILAVIRDLSDVHRDAQVLCDTRSMLQALVAVQPGAVCFVDEAGCCRELFVPSSDWLLRPVIEYLGRPVCELFLPVSQPAWDAARAAVRRDQRPQALCLQVEDGIGNPCICQGVLYPCFRDGYLLMFEHSSRPS